MSTHFALLVNLLVAANLLTDGPADNVAEKVRRVPPPGIAVPENVRAELRSGCDELAKTIDGLRTTLADKPELIALLPDVEIYHKAVEWALRYDEFYDAKEFAVALVTAAAAGAYPLLLFGTGGMTLTEIRGVLRGRRVAPEDLS